MKVRRRFVLLCLGVMAAAFILAGCATTAGAKTGSPELSFQPPAGTYAEAQSVVILPSAKDSTVYYSTDGSDPTPEKGKKYTVPIGIDSTMILKAVARLPNGRTGAVTSALYKMTGTVEAPVIAPAGGTFGNDVLVTLGTATAGARVRYTLDGSAPDESHGMEYSGVPIRVDATLTVKAVGFREGWKNSSVSIESYDMIVETPVIVPPPGVLGFAQPVSISTGTAGASIRYTTDSSEPTEANGKEYSGPFALETARTVRAVALRKGWTASALASSFFVVNAAIPVFSPPAGTFSSPIAVSFGDPGPGFRIRYTDDGSEPGGETGLEYMSPIPVSSTVTIKAVIVGPGRKDSPAASATYTFSGTVAAPVISPPGGTYSLDRKISFSCATPGALIRYTTDGSPPTATSGTMYSEPFPGAGTLTVNAIALKPEWKESPVSSAVFTFINTPDMVLVRGGTFDMGYAAGEEDERPVHGVTLSPFYIGKYEVTQAQYESVMGSNPSSFKTAPDSGTHPVEQVSWFSAIAYCNELSDSEGFQRVYAVTGAKVSADHGKNGYRLPTEAEWEFAARGGVVGTAAASVGFKFAGSDDAETVSWNSRNSEGTTHPAGGKEPNGIGIYDMTGNVWEWCYDWYDAYSASPAGIPQTDPRGPSNGTQRVKRGGSWNRYSDFSRVTFRNYHNPLNNDKSIGFRVVRSVLK